MITRLLEGVRRRVANRRTGVAVSYSPRADGQPDPGEVVWTWVAYEDDPTQGKDRPVVVIGTSGEQLAAVALTTKSHGPTDDRVPVGTGPWDAARRPSFAKVDRLLIVAPSAVRREGAALARERFDEVVVAVRLRHPGELDGRSEPVR